MAGPEDVLSACFVRTREYVCRTHPWRCVEETDGENSTIPHAARNFIVNEAYN